MMNGKKFSVAAMAGLLAVGVVSPMRASGQITITSDDMFNQIGQWYRQYANASDMDATGLAGTVGGPQVWNFAAGPQDLVYRFDIVDRLDGGHGADFPDAAFAERKTNESTSAQSWMYLKQAPGSGRANYGFYDPAFSATMPSTPFASPIVDFPASMAMGNSWSVGTSFETEVDVLGMFVWPARILYSASATVDAHGIINLPGIGFSDCLRINEIATYVVEVDAFDDGEEGEPLESLDPNYQYFTTYYVRNYYWLCKEKGIVAQLTSPQETAPPADGFPIAAQFVRTFELHHPVIENPPGAVTNLTITVTGGRALLTWSKPAYASRFVLQATAEPGPQAVWETLTNTTANFYVDESPSTVLRRCYRVESQK